MVSGFFRQCAQSPHRHRTLIRLALVRGRVSGAPHPPRLSLPDVLLTLLVA